MQAPLVVFDTETAALHGPPHLLELGAIRVVDGEVCDHFDSLVRPRVPVEEEARHVHGIEDEELFQAPPPEEVLPAFLEWLGDDWLCAHNAGFDARVLGFEFARLELEPPAAPVVDTLPLARRCVPEAPDHKLETLCRHLELETDTHHRALADAASCWQLLEHCLAQLEPEQRTLTWLLARGPGAPVTLEGAVPRGPQRLPRKLRPLLGALEAQEMATLTYGSGAERPARLRVLPRLLFQMGRRDYLEAECVDSSQLKLYRLDRIQKVELANATT